MKKKKEVKFWNDTIQKITKLRKPVVINSVCPNCGAKGHRTTLTNNSYACKKCKTWWVNGG